MKIPTLKFAVGLYTAIIFSSTFSTARAAENIVTDFASILLGTIQCTCSGATYMITMENLTYQTKTLTYMPGVSALKLDYNFYTTGVQFLGQYTIDTGMCLIYAGTSCTTLTADGLISPTPYQGMGTSGQSVLGG